MAWLTDEEYAADELAKRERELRDIERSYSDGRVRDVLGMQLRESEVRREIERLRAELESFQDDRDEE